METTFIGLYVGILRGFLYLNIMKVQISLRIDYSIPE